MRFSRPHRRALSRVLAAALLCGVAACGTVVINQTGSLTRYDQLRKSTSTATEARLFADRPALQRMRTVRIIPTAFPANVEGSAPLTPADRRLIANAADRALCYDLSLRYDIVTSRDADLTVRAQVTRVEPTNLIGAGGTIAGSAAVTVASQLGVGFAEGIGRIPIPRLPIGLGSLTVEAEALDLRREQRAAMVWGGAANSFTSQPRFSPASDPYDLAGEFGQDFGYLMATGDDPFTAPNTLPTWDRIRVTALGEAPLDPDCEAFGRAPGIDGMLTDYIGLPPEYGDKGPAADRAVPVR
ncbi:DUF3313 domain-containing protein [Methylobacterium aerolatum]|uniref:DUF3313 domain-containing protein n=1 Tax=Methylobacterium aerolatum TaxID=418708 RepID=A0ABU0HZH3_9HYPH|nr:DUF3313 domain-containing protein [Methylobacterium aerolatum]MDQ0446864.1 hypothetical protein [Methylobacterium aerolatum]GJD33829.1 hypothetical protein FMGBMHLM_0724 [Methylobacterium aerolatum]